MYSVFNSDVGFFSMNQEVVSYKTGLIRVGYISRSIIRGSSTVNGDSAHSTDPLARQHNYVSFYVNSIEVRYEIIVNLTSTSRLQYPIHIILFKVPYKDDQTLKSTLITNRLDGMILYSHPECVLAYDVINFIKTSTHDRLLQCKKPFFVRPNEYVGILYYIPVPEGMGTDFFKVFGSAKVVFKPQ